MAKSVEWRNLFNIFFLSGLRLTMDKSNIRNHTADFLIFTKEVGGNGIEVRVENETIWLTQKLMAELSTRQSRTFLFI